MSTRGTSNPLEQQVSVVSLLASHEDALADLYTAYARQFPEQSDFWLGLAREERDHSRWVYTLGSHIERGFIVFPEGRFNAVAITHSLDYVRQQVVAADRGYLSLVNALSRAFDLENALLDRGFFATLKTDSGQLKKVLRALSYATERHKGTIEAAWASLRISANVAVCPSP